VNAATFSPIAYSLRSFLSVQRSTNAQQASTLSITKASLPRSWAGIESPALSVAPCYLFLGHIYGEIASVLVVERSHDDPILTGCFALEDDLGVGAAAAIVVLGELFALGVFEP
jgi:hypothetical protein